MVLDGVANFVRVSTAESVDSTQTTLAVTDASEFPSEDHNAVLWDSAQYPRPDQDPNVEIIRVTAADTSTDTLTISRGEEGTAAVSHPDGSALAVAPTAKMFSDIESAIANAGGKELVSYAKFTIDYGEAPVYACYNFNEERIVWKTADGTSGYIPSRDLSYTIEKTDILATYIDSDDASIIEVFKLE